MTGAGPYVGTCKNGMVTTNLGNQEQGYAVALDAKGKIMLAGISFSNGSDYDMVVARYLTR